MKLKNLILFLITLLIFSLSCKKEPIKQDLVYKDLVSIQQIKDYFNTQILGKSVQTLAKKDLTIEQIIRDENVNDLLYKEPLWDKAYIKNLGDKIGLAIPIHFKVTSYVRTSDKTGINYDKLNYLLISQGTNKELTYDWVTLMPDSNWIKGDRKEFTGRIKTADWDGNLKEMFVYNKANKIIKFKRPSDNNILRNTWLAFNKQNQPIAGILDNRKYKDVNGDCWEDLREVQHTDGVGVTLYRKKIDCAELDPPAPGEDPENPGEGPGPGGGGGGGSGGGSSLPPQNCIDDPNYDPANLPPLPDGLYYLPKCEVPITEDPIEESYSLELDQNKAILCGLPAVMAVGNGFTGGVENLGFVMNFKTNGNVTSSWSVIIGASCFTTKNSTAALSSAAFLAAYNTAVTAVMYEAKYGIIPILNSTTLRIALVAQINLALTATGGFGSTYSTGPCLGGVPSTVATYCP